MSPGCGVVDVSTLDLPEGVGAVVKHCAHGRFTRSSSPRRQDRVREPLMHSHRALLRHGRGQERFRPPNVSRETTSRTEAPRM